MGRSSTAPQSAGRSLGVADKSLRLRLWNRQYDRIDSGRVVAKLDVERFALGRRDGEGIFDEACGDRDGGHEIGVAADRVEQEKFVTAQSALFFWCGYAAHGL